MPSETTPGCSLILEKKKIYIYKIKPVTVCHGMAVLFFYSPLSWQAKHVFSKTEFVILKFMWTLEGNGHSFSLLNQSVIYREHTRYNTKQKCLLQKRGLGALH